MSPDLVNGLFEFGGACFLTLRLRRLYRDKLVRGADWRATAFFGAWGYWNLYYYPHLDQMWSFAGGSAIVAVNTTLVGMMLYYIRRERLARRDPA